jgi:hypothetical protein
MQALRTLICVTAVAAVVASVGVPPARSNSTHGAPDMPMPDTVTGLHDFDFLVGRWRVHHRRLKERLAGSHEWIEFDGTSELRTLMGGYGNVDDNVMDLPAGRYRAASLRSFEPRSNTWSIWFLDGRTPLGPLDPPVRGRFRDGVGTFLGDDTFNGVPIRVRYTWSKITPRSAHWAQAFSTDGGATWETNWEMEFTRIDG